MSHYHVDSAGTSDWHQGQAPDARAQAASMRVGVDISRHRARAVIAEDFERFDVIVACDEQNLIDLRTRCPVPRASKLHLLMPFAGDDSRTEVPDPYYGSEDDFDETVASCQAACAGLLEWLEQGRSTKADR